MDDPNQTEVTESSQPSSPKKRKVDPQAEVGNHYKKQSNENGGSSVMTTWKFDQNVIRKALARMIIIDELPFKFIESKGFQEFCSVAIPRFHIPSRQIISRDCYEIFLEEKLKKIFFLQVNCQRICLTINTWTSMQRTNYMCITGHFIDIDWKLHRMVLNFVPITSHKGELIGKAIEKSLHDWGVSKVMTITVDNASCNETAISFLKKRISNWGEGIILNGDFLHVRCVAHIINLVVQDGLNIAQLSIVKVRESVRYVRQSPKRFQLFNTCVEQEKIEGKAHLSLDVCTRWNSTYIMLDVAQRYERAFERFNEEDPYFQLELLDSDAGGRPLENDWKVVRELVSMLQIFYQFTLKASTSLSTTCNLYVNEISQVASTLNEWVDDMNLDPMFHEMAVKMKQKWDKYWECVDKLNMILFMAIIFDPRYKFDYLKFALSKMYGEDKVSLIISKVEINLHRIFNEYKSKIQMTMNSARGSSSTVAKATNVTVEHKLTKIELKYKRFKAHITGQEKTELEKYLCAEPENADKSFEILTWWKMNAIRYPVLSSIVRDIMSIPISTMASEFVFSTSSRVLDPFRSSLSPAMLEALICSQDWIRANKQREVEENLEDVDMLDKVISTIHSAPGVINLHT